MIPPYEFSYNETQLPGKNSYYIDYWGYYNGKNNTQITGNVWFGPVDTQYPFEITEDQPLLNYFKMLSPLIKTPGIYLNGADRGVNVDKMQASILKSIQYPTGATVDFIYEPNDYYDEENTLYEYDDLTTVTVSDLGWDDYPEGWESEFTLNDPTIVDLSFQIRDRKGTRGSFNFSTAALRDKYNNDIMYVYDDIILNDDGKLDYFASVVLNPGTYRIKANVTLEDMEATVTAKYRNTYVTTKKKGAGLRIKSVITKDEGLVVRQTNYSYENDGISTGRMVSPPKFFFTATLFSAPLSNQVVYTDHYVIRYSGGVAPLGNSAQGSPIGYDEVFVTHVDPSNNTLGSSKYYYKNIEERPIELFIPEVPNLINLSNGQLLKEEHYNQTGDLVKLAVMGYTQKPTTLMIKGVKVYNFLTAANTEVRFYDVMSKWWHPASTTETIYDPDGGIR